MKKDSAVSIRMTDTVKKAAEKAARDDDRPVAAWIHKIMIDHLRQVGLLK